MDKKEFPSALPKEGGFSPKAGGKLPDKLFGLLKFSLGILLLPFVYSATVSFLNEIKTIEKAATNYFFSGIIAFLIVYLFIYEPIKIYNRGQKILEAVFRFITPLVKVAPFLLPIYTIILYCAYFIYSLFDKTDKPLNIFVLLFGFSIALHLVFSAKTLRTRSGDFLKSNYIFGFSFVYLLNLGLLAFVFNLIFSHYSLVNFCNYSFQVAKSIFSAVFHQLFLR